MVCSRDGKARVLFGARIAQGRCMWWNWRESPVISSILTPRESLSFKGYGPTVTLIATERRTISNFYTMMAMEGQMAETRAIEKLENAAGYPLLAMEDEK
ncbi:hypothetical protein O6H91_Y480500 [Diphasiastrum complanatum]|nr:hypothetical protein O6H91_Y480500 [Diphasiastrum complanatum]